MKKIKVLIIDDSALIRQLVKKLILNEPFISEVETSVDASFAIHKIEKFQPDVIILDLQMPKMNGLIFLEKIKHIYNIPVIIFSSYAEEGSYNAIKALENGAIEIIPKPVITNEETLNSFKDTILNAILTAANANLDFDKSINELKDLEIPNNQIDIIGIGASTGGTDAIKKIITKLPAECPPIVIVIHMPPGFTNSFAQRLSQLSKLNFTEAKDNMKLYSGMGVVAPGDKHLTIHKINDTVVTKLSDTAPVNRHKPSIDPLFLSIAKNFQKKSLGIILTGMGKDGVKGLLEMKKNGAITIAQDKATSVVFGMPRAAIEAKAVDYVLPISEIGNFIIKILKK